MKKLSRRKFLGGTAAVATAAVVGSSDDLSWTLNGETNSLVKPEEVVAESLEIMNSAVKELSPTKRWVKADRVPAHLKHGWGYSGVERTMSDESTMHLMQAQNVYNPDFLEDWHI